MQRFPLSSAQRWVFDHCLAYPGSTQYNLPAVTRLVPEVNAAGLAAAWRQLAELRPVLKTRFALDADGEPYQWSDAAMAVPVTERRMSAAELELYLSRRDGQGFLRPFDLTGGGPLWRVELVTTEKGTVMLTDLQHALFDGVTFNKLMWGRDLVRLYEGKKISPCEWGLYESAADEAELKQGAAYLKAREECLARFDGVEFTTLSKSAADTSGALVRVREYVPQSACDEYCRRAGTDAPGLFLAAFARVLCAQSGQESVALSLKHHGRLERRQLKSYGMYVGFLPLLLERIAALPDAELLAACRTEIAAALGRAVYPVRDFAHELGRVPRLIYNFLALKGMDTCLHLEGAAMPTVLLEGGTTEDELSLNIYLRGEDYEIRVEASDGMYSAARLRQVAQAVRDAVTALYSTN